MLDLPHPGAIGVGISADKQCRRGEITKPAVRLIVHHREVYLLGLLGGTRVTRSPMGLADARACARNIGSSHSPGRLMTSLRRRCP